MSSVTAAAPAKKKPKRRNSVKKRTSLTKRVWRGALVYSLGIKIMVKNPTKAHRASGGAKKPRGSAGKKSPRIKAKRSSKKTVGGVKKATGIKKATGDAKNGPRHSTTKAGKPPEPGNVASGKRKKKKKRKVASQAHIVRLKKHLAAAQANIEQLKADMKTKEKIKKTRATEIKLCDVIGDLEDENGQLREQIECSGGASSKSEQLLVNAQQNILELKKQLRETQTYQFDRAGEERERQLQSKADEQAHEIVRLKVQLADALVKIALNDDYMDGESDDSEGAQTIDKDSDDFDGGKREGADVSSTFLEF